MLRAIVLVPSPVSCAQEAVNGNLDLLEKLTKDADLTRRELCLLASAVTEMQRAGLKPYEEQFCIQLATGTIFKLVRLYLSMWAFASMQFFDAVVPKGFKVTNTKVDERLFF